MCDGDTAGSGTELAMRPFRHLRDTAASEGAALMWAAYYTATQPWCVQHMIQPHSSDIGRCTYDAGMPLIQQVRFMVGQGTSGNPYAGNRLTVSTKSGV